MSSPSLGLSRKNNFSTLTKTIHPLTKTSPSSLPCDNVFYRIVSFLIPNPQLAVSLYTFIYQESAWSGRSGYVPSGISGDNWTNLTKPSEYSYSSVLQIIGQYRYQLSPWQSHPHTPHDHPQNYPPHRRFFSPSFLVREDPILLSSADVCCCTYWEDVGNTIPLCEG